MSMAGVVVRIQVVSSRTWCEEVGGKSVAVSRRECRRVRKKWAERVTAFLHMFGCRLPCSTTAMAAVPGPQGTESVAAKRTEHRSTGSESKVHELLDGGGVNVTLLLSRGCGRRSVSGGFGRSEGLVRPGRSTWRP